MINQIFTNPLIFLIQAVCLVAAITIHELAHAWTADRLGDPNPRLQGRISLNPLVHLDPIGTIMLVLTRFGWGKPVPIDPFNFKNRRRDTALSSFAGPLSNLVLSGLASFLLRLFSLPFYIHILFLSLISVNISLAIFNLIPIPPLDGSKILFALLPEESSREWQELLSSYSTILLILILIPFNGPSMASRIIGPIAGFIIKLFLNA